MENDDGISLLPSSLQRKMNRDGSPDLCKTLAGIYTESTRKFLSIERPGISRYGLWPSFAWLCFHLICSAENPKVTRDDCYSMQREFLFRF